MDLKADVAVPTHAGLLVEFLVWHAAAVVIHRRYAVVHKIAIGPIADQDDVEMLLDTRPRGPVDWRGARWVCPV